MVNEMDDKSSYSWGGIGFLALFFLIIIAFWGRGGNGFGNWGNGSGLATGALLGADLTGLTNSGYQNYQATCEAEKAQMRDTARTQYLIEQTANATQTKIDFYAYQDLRDKLGEAQRQNMMLQNQIFVKDQLAPVNEQLASIRCNMLRRPDVTGIGVSCPSAAILNGLGINSLNGWNGGCGCSGSNSLV